MINTTKYWDALVATASDGGYIHVHAARVVLSLALDEQYDAIVPTGRDWRWCQQQVDHLIMWLDVEELGYAPPEDLVTAIQRILAKPKANDTNTDWKSLAHDLEEMLNDARNDSRELGADLETLQVAANAECASLRQSIRDQDATIQNQCAEINRLTLVAQERGEIMTAINKGLAEIAPHPGITFADGKAPFPAGDLEIALSQADEDPPALPVIDFSGLPDDYIGTTHDLLDGKLQWSAISIQARRSIALHVISQLADGGSLTMAAFDSNRLPFMPTAAAMVQMFGIRWSGIVENAVSHA
jgi:hypothetical protein